MVKLQEHAKQFFCTIPRDIITVAGFKKFDRLLVSYDSRNNYVIIEKIEEK